MRPPGYLPVWEWRLLLWSKATKTVPTGLPSCSEGPATPVMPMPMSAPSSVRAARAIAAATSSLMTPCFSMSWGSTPWAALTSVA